MNIIKLAIAPAFVLLAGCVTYPYQSAFDSCDAEAGACYRYCDDVAASDYELGACHNDCDRDANQCFASAYDSYSYGGSAYSGSYYQPSWPWRGRYGGWGPSNGYYFDFGYAGGSHGYDRPRRSRGYGRPQNGGNNNNQGAYDGRRGNRGDDRRGAGDNNTRPPRGATTPPPITRSAPGPSTSPPPAPQSTPPPPPPVRTKPAQRPTKPKSERGQSNDATRQDY